MNLTGSWAELLLSKAGTYHPFSVLIYNQKNNVRVLIFGTAATKGFPVMFDGRNERGD